MTSYTDATETASTGEGKRNRKTQALSALLSATALGVFLEGCSGGDGGGAGAPPTPGSGGDSSLYFADANGFNDFSFARTGDNSEDVEITVGGVSETILGFANNVYTLYYGSLGTGTELGKLYVGTENANVLRSNDDGANVIIGLGDGDSLYGGDGNDILDGGAGTDDLFGKGGNDVIYGGDGTDYLNGNDGNDKLYGEADADTYVFRVGDGTDDIFDVAGDTMILRFEGGDYEETDFTSAVFERDGNNLVITLDKDPNDGITDKITINNAYDTNTNTGPEGSNLAFTINIQYGAEGGTFTTVADIWSALT